MMLGVSRPRNVNLSSAFIKLGLAEGWGSGIRNIKKQYEKLFNFMLKTLQHSTKAKNQIYNILS